MVLGLSKRLARQCCPLGGRTYYEIEILDISDFSRHRYGLASVAFERVMGASATGLGDDAASWMVNGMASVAIHNGEEKPYACDKWKAGDVVGLACDLEAMQMLVSLNGSFDAPNGRVFDLAPDAVGKGLFAAFSGANGKVRYNLGEAPLKHAPPSADYVAFSEFDADTCAKD